MPDCVDRAEKISAFIDGELGTDEAEAVASHIEECPECRALSEQFRRIDEIAAAQPVPEVSEEEWARVWEKVAWSLEVPEQPKSKARWFRYAVTLAAAACLLLAASQLLFMPQGTPVPQEWKTMHQSSLEEIASQGGPVYAEFREGFTLVKMSSIEQ